MKKQQYQWVLLALGLAVSVGCTVPFLVNTRDNTGALGNGQVITDPNAVSSSLPIFLPQPGSSSPPLTLVPPSAGPFQPGSSGNLTIDGPLPAPTATPFLADNTPNIDNQILANALPILGIGQNGSSGGSGGVITTQPIIKSIIKGRVLGLDPATGQYKPLPNAQVRVDENVSLISDSNGFYATSQEFDELVSISAASDFYIASTVTDVPPGISRDIHLNPLVERPPYRQDTFLIDGSLTNLSKNGRRPTVVYTDGVQSVSNAAFVNPVTGRYQIDVRLRNNRSSTTGHLFSYVNEQIGKLSVITQYGYSPNVAVPVPPPQPVPTPTPDLGDSTFVPLKSTDLLLSFNHLVSPSAFGELKVNFTAPTGTGLEGSVLHVYMNFPDGGRVLVAKYNDNTSTSIIQTIRVPQIANTSFTLMAHSGSSQQGSDIVVPNLQIGSSISREFLPTPVFNRVGDETDFSDPKQTHFETSDTNPLISWDTMPNVNSWQLDLQGDTPESFRWEAYALGTSINYPDFGTDHPLSLQEGRNYRLQLMASDFDLGTFNILSQGSEQWQQPNRFSQTFESLNEGGFSVNVLNPTLNNFAQGYRISYSTITFLTD